MRSGSREVDGDFTWESFDENTACGMCYTSGTTGNPKGVVYSHRSNVLHSMMALTPDAFDLSVQDTIMPVVPFFHANGWTIAFSAPMAGCRLVLPGMKLDGVSIYELLEGERVTMTAAVPTIWLMLLAHMEANNLKLSTLRRVLIGGSACPRAMIEKFEKNYGVTVAHAWGMTEMNPIGSICAIKPDYDANDYEKLLDVKSKQGAAPFTVEMKIVDDAEKELPWDGKTFGRLKVKGVAVAKSYFKGEGGEILDENGFFDTGDVATIDPFGNMQITDRSKDVIKSGGEWISSIDLENLAVGHPEGDGGRRDRHPPSEMGRAPAADHHPEEGREPDARGNPRLHGRQDRQVVDARRRGVRERDSAHRHGQDPEDRAARPVQGLHAADRGGRRRVAHVPEKPDRSGGTGSPTRTCASKRMDTFDYVIVGAGTAGCILANRLSEDAGVSVCVLEAGPRDWHPYIHIPAGFIKLFHQPRR